MRTRRLWFGCRDVLLFCDVFNLDSAIISANALELIPPVFLVGYYGRLFIDKITFLNTCVQKPRSLRRVLLIEI